MARLFLTNDRRTELDQTDVPVAEIKEGAAGRQPLDRDERTAVRAKGQRARCNARVRRLAVILPSGYRDVAG